MDLTEKRYSLGFIAALLTAIVFLAVYIKTQDNKINNLVDKIIECERQNITDSLVIDSLYQLK